jgi:hypothetical protein
MLEFAGPLSPAALRHLACDCGVVPVVCSTGPVNPSTSAGSPAPCPTGSAARSPAATAAAPTPAATAHPGPGTYFDQYWWIPIVGPLIGGVVGICAYDLLVGSTLVARRRAGEGAEPGRVPDADDE